MSDQKKRKRNQYSAEFKSQAIELAKEIGAVKAAEKLGIENHQTLGAWVRYSKKVDENQDFCELEKLREENKRLKKELEYEKKSVAILKDATAFFCQNQDRWGLK